MRVMQDTLHYYTPVKECCKPFDKDEIMAVIKAMKTKGTPGADSISPSFIEPLGPKALELLLKIYNHSFATGDIPSAFNSGTP